VDAPPRWLPRIQAAQALGISERTLDRRLARGQLERRYDEHGAVLIAIPTDPGLDKLTDVDRTLVVLEKMDGALAPLVAHTLEQEATLVRQAEELGALRSQMTDLDLATVLAPLTAHLAAQEQTIVRQATELATLRAALEAATRPYWWRRLLARFRSTRGTTT